MIHATPMIETLPTTRIAADKPAAPTGRIAVFTSQFPSRVSTFFARDVHALARAGYEIDIFPIYPLNSDLWRYVPAWWDDEALPRERVRHLDMSESVRGIKPWQWKSTAIALRESLRIAASALKFGWSPLAKSMYVVPKALRWAEQYAGRYDQVFSYWGNYAATCAQLFHRLACPQAPFSFILHAGTDLYRDQVYLEQKLLYADRVFVVCEFNRAFLEATFPRIYPRVASKIQLHHLGLDLQEYAYQPENRAKRKIVGVGSFETSKGFQFLLDAVRLLRDRDYPVELELIGDGPEEPRFRTFIDQHGLRDQVTLRGWLPADEARRAMSGATTLVHPTAALGDAVPTVIKEALALGTPVISTRIVGIPELLDQGRCGLLVPPADATSLADAIQHLMCDGDLRQRFAERGRAYAEHMFDMWRNGEQLAQTLRETRRTAN